jgi:hypothetical protein
MRFDTVVPHLFREAAKEEVVPLSVPVNCKSGNVINELHIPKGTHVIVSDIAYHRYRYHTLLAFSRLTENDSGTRIFGVTTQMCGGQAGGWTGQSRPQEVTWGCGGLCKWKIFSLCLSFTDSPRISFGAGHRACLGWRFA